MTTSPESRTASIGAALPDYEISRELGRGAMGVVYLGRHRRLRRDVAVKELAGPLAEDPDVRARFLTEARTLALLDHPHVVPVYDYVEDGHRCLLIMEALGGGTAWDRFSTTGLDAPAACALTLATCAGVHHAHQHGVLHRDIKPENLLFSATGDLKVTDFGIAKVLDGGRTLATIDGSVLGTPAYMAPEQAEGGEVGPSTDVYAIATMLYEFLSGHLPFEGDSPMAMVVQRLTTDPPALASAAPDVPAEIAEVVMSGLARDAAERPGDAEDFGCRLAAAAVAAWGPTWHEGAGVPLAGSRAIVAAAQPGLTLPPAARAGAGTVAPTTTPDTHDTIAPGATPDTHEPTVSDTIAGSTAEPVAPAGPATVVPERATAAPARAAVLPLGGPARAGFDGSSVDPRALVSIERVIEREAPIALPAAITAIAFAAAVTLALLAPTPVEAPDAGPVPRITPGAEGSVSEDGTVATIDLGEPILVDVSGIDGAADVEIEVALAGMGLGRATAPVVGTTATVDLGGTGWLIYGPATATVTAQRSNGAPVSSRDVALVDDGAPWTSAQVPVLVALALFGLASAESQTRRHRRGRVRTGAVVGAALAGALAGATGVLLWASTGTAPVGAGSVAAVAVAAGVAAAAATVLRARRARRHRLLRRVGR